MIKSIEDRIFRRGVSDQDVQRAIELTKEFLEDHLLDTASDLEWWERFEVFFTELTRAMTEQQLVAVEIATDTLLIHSGSQPWSLARVGLAVSRKGVAPPDEEG